jgi:hypothetical protein
MSNTTDLTKENARIGLRIINKANPEWGVATLGRDGQFWTFKNRAGEAVLFEGEFHFWRLA